MAIMLVKPRTRSLRKQKGASLIELMVASVIGVFAISIIGSVFITGHRIAQDKGIELLLLQNLTSTIQIMKEDIQRAGYDGSNGESLKLSGAVNTINVSAGVEVGFVYFKEGSTDGKNYRNIVYKKEGTRLKICEKGVLTPVGILSHDQVSLCYSLFDDSIISVDDLSISSHVLSKNGVSTTLTDVNIIASIPSAGISKSVAITVKQRNWQ
ncbi:PilW family protein [Vibrio atlanticus]|uniref:Pilus assembly protein PilW n=1 Tax=Vibrio atlanticus TaxID=693153 RepID=A0A1C3ILB5_9VIBR|nr:prepilin-type N-terminal cleavage/methylation domain-containing protein [Vibrio atlanticus]SBS62201.1 hypothetical protein VAT7223_01030 [Vibrio atlanticus]